MENTNKDLDWLQEQLLAEEDPLDDEQLYALLKEDPEPAFDDPADYREPKDPHIYRNYSNAYGAEAPESQTNRQKERDDKTIIGLMITASALCLGILGVLVYWMEAFIR